MKIKEFIERLQKMNPDALVVRRRYEGNGYYRYEGFEGWWPRFEDLISEDNDDYYREAREGEPNAQEALTL